MSDITITISGPGQTFGNVDVILPIVSALEKSGHKVAVINQYPDVGTQPSYRKHNVTIIADHRPWGG